MAAHQAPPSLGFSWQEHWSGLPFPSPRHESEKWKWSRSVVSRLLATPWTTAYQAPPSMGFSRQEYWSGLPLPSPRNTWSTRQIWPWSTEWGRAKANWVLPRECTGHSKHPLPTTQEKTLHMDNTRWSIQNQIDFNFEAKNGEALYSQQKQDQELTVDQIMNSLLPNSDWNWSRENH